MTDREGNKGIFRGCTTSKTSAEDYYAGKIGQLFRFIVLMDLYEYYASTIGTRYGVRLLEAATSSRLTD